ncbi:3-dehydroquinate synthase [Porifericola rhodea]|uniref:3-dehydroquinate synthase n=1 Tax=Porifericola rhodea TaxID=930972 RepID=UPI0026666734|nr:3-dehydroquinate synthase [Porifericola rhodea]WKN32301.1 3-dehydroquinate synthase [Porifericola rhodea]
MPAKNVTLTSNIDATLKEFFAQHTYSLIGVLVDENTKEHCYPIIKDNLPEHELCQIPSGELNKNLSTCSDIWEWMTKAHFDRKALLVNLGGGVIGDMGGFCAATYKRGIDFINLPTTLLAQVDASVGGKLGIDFQAYKNHIGLFQEPQQVIVYPQFIYTLPKEEIRSGFAEVIKHSLIQDALYWPKLKEAGVAPDDWTAHIDHSIKIKAGVVDADFKEGGLRKILNYGHTIGHAIESYFLETERRLLHGEAIAIGMVAEGILSVKYSGMPQAEADEMSQFLLDTYGYHEISEQEEADIIGLTHQDKKNEKGVIKCTLLERIGKATYDINISAQDVAEGLAYYRSFKK